MINNMETVKYTATLPSEFVNELKELASKSAIPSVNYGIGEAISIYIHDIKQKNYEAQMKAAACDNDFIERTLNCEEDFLYVDSEVNGNDK